MSAASTPRPGAASTDARRPVADPAAGAATTGAPGPSANGAKVDRKAWKVDLRELGRRAGTLREWDKTIPAPARWGNEMIGIDEGAPVGLHLRLESVMEGVLVSGEVDVPLTGQCSRCLDPFEDTLQLDVQELYAYAGSTTEATSGEDEVRRIEGDSLDLEPLVRDTVVLALPLSPTCTPDCAGLCVDCGERLDDLPADHSHEVIDPRFAGLAARFADLTETTDGTQPGPRGTENEEN